MQNNEKEKRSLSSKIIITIIVIIFIAGLCVFSYPTVSNTLAVHQQIVATQSYINYISGLSNEEIEKELKKAISYNERLGNSEVKDPFSNTNNIEPFDEYDDTLNINGIMGYIEIPKINVKIPIYHGVTNEVLEKGVGHIKATALPIGGEGLHPVLTGHTGMPQAKLFTDLVKLKEEDVFYIYVLNQTLEYKIDQIRVVEPDDISQLVPIAGEDHITLITCTPYGINSHRLLVRGIRCELDEDIKNQLEKENENQITKLPWWFIVLILIVFVIIIIFITKKLKKKD